MKNSNPFNRVKQENSVDYSVFPAHKTTRTSMRIGEVTPVYAIEMIQGNHIELGLSQLTRFMTMDRPVMNDFEVNFGAFFVPYRALNKLAGHGIYTAQFLESLGDDIGSISLHAFDYEIWFNPITPDAWRSSHWFERFNPFTATNYSGKIVGSLYDHLGYLYPWDYLLNSFTCRVTVPSSGSDFSFNIGDSFRDFYTAACSPSLSVDNKTVVFDCILPSLVSGSVQVPSVQGMPKVGFIPFDLYCVLNPEFAFTPSPLQLEQKFSTSVKISTLNNNHVWSYFVDSQTASQVGFFTVGLQNWNKLVSGDTSVDIRELTNNKFTRLEQLVTAYYQEYIAFCSQYLIDNTINPQTILPLLVYLRIYGDYFLHPNYEDKNKWFEWIGACYLSDYAANSSSKINDFLFYLRSNDFTSSQRCDFYADRLLKGECLPCMWETDPFTCIVPYGVDSGAGSVKIADGDSVQDLFYKRNYARFKDMIARLGTDFKTNVTNLYGSEPNLTSETSQVVGFRKFPVRLQAIAQTSSGSDKSTQLADFAGFAYTNDSCGGFSWTAEEHGIFMVLAWVRPRKIAYFSRLDRWTVKSAYSDFLNPYLGGVGFEDVQVMDITGGRLNNQAVGQRERYFDYMCLNNEVSGAFRTIARNYSVDRDIDYTPVLGVNKPTLEFFYITERDDVQRVFNDMVNDPILVQIEFEGSVTRQLPAVMKLGF